MRLDDFLANAERAHLAPTLPVKFKMIGKTKDRQPIIFDVEAQLVFVDEDAAQVATREARAQEAADDLYKTERAYRLLSQALRDKDNPAVLFASSVEQLKRALVAPVAAALMRQYSNFLEKEFPEEPTDDQLKAAEIEAEKNL